MTATDVIKKVKSSGGSLAVIDGSLKGKNLKSLDDETRDQVKKYKAEIILLLTAKNEQDILPQHKDTLKPFINLNGELVIPRDCNPKYKWWREGGQSVYATLLELGATDAIISRYVGPIFNMEAYEFRRGVA